MWKKIFLVTIYFRVVCQLSDGHEWSEMVTYFVLDFTFGKLISALLILDSFERCKNAEQFVKMLHLTRIMCDTNCEKWVILKSCRYSSWNESSIKVNINQATILLNLIRMSYCSKSKIWIWIDVCSACYEYKTNTQ